MTDTAKFEVAISAIVDVKTNDSEHPFLTLATFVFADDKPNANRQAVEYSEFENIKNTAIGMPVKMRYKGNDLGEHDGSVPIGVIKAMREEERPDGSHVLIAEALLWKEEYPQEVDFLKEKFASGEAPGISYELGYADSETKSGIQWIKRVVTLAATFVKHPAYGQRTKLLALASDNLTAEKLGAEILTLTDNGNVLPLQEVIDILEKQLPPSGQSSNEGGNQMEEELEKQKALATSLQTQIDDLTAQLTEKDTVIAEKETTIKDLQFAALVDSRTRRFVEAGFTLEADAEKAEKKKTLLASLSDELFDQYLEDLVAAKAAATPAKPEPTLSPAVAAIAKASAASAMPKLEVSDEGVMNLKQAMKSLARPNSID